MQAIVQPLSRLGRQLCQPVIKRMPPSDQVHAIDSARPKADAPIPVFVINLDRSADRLEAVRESGRAFGIELHRLPAVEHGLDR